eukprot:TRINITY_DN61570_c0_g1_i1.p1 TRINITY_DN61570_c0_g1~~TRINITY_DN61570_c0_g1_i1.p1  ORF type:complete len:365 (+),score=64.43 TRINITY_DN61570_c0_g1_i1:154-1248(+)
MADKIRQILEAAELLRKGDVVSGVRQIAAATDPTAVPNPASTFASKVGPQQAATIWTNLVASRAGAAAASIGSSLPSFVADPEKLAALGIDPDRLKLAQIVGSLRLRMIQEQVQQKYLEAYTQQLVEAQQHAHRLHEQQQEAAQLALIMEAANAQAEVAKQSLEDDQADYHWHRRLGRKSEVCGHWKRGHCTRSDKCQFGHPEKERGLLQPRGPADIMRHNFKTSLCKNFASGSCPQGVRCMFAHGPKELRAPGASLAKDEEEIVQRVAAAKIARPPGSSPAALVAAGMAVPAPSGSSLGTLAGALGAASATPNPWASFGGSAEMQLQKESVQALAMNRLVALGLDPSKIDIAQASLEKRARLS